MKTNMEINPKACEERQCKHVSCRGIFFARNWSKDIRFSFNSETWYEIRPFLQNPGKHDKEIILIDSKCF